MCGQSGVFQTKAGEKGWNLSHFSAKRWCISEIIRIFAAIITITRLTTVFTDDNPARTVHQQMFGGYVRFHPQWLTLEASYYRQSGKTVDSDMQARDIRAWMVAPKATVRLSRRYDCIVGYDCLSGDDFVLRHLPLSGHRRRHLRARPSARPQRRADGQIQVLQRHHPLSRLHPDARHRDDGAPEAGRQQQQRPMGMALAHRHAQPLHHQMVIINS